MQQFVHPRGVLSTWIVACGALAVLAFPATAHAQLVFTLAPDTYQAFPGSTLTLTATLENQSAVDTYFLNGIQNTNIESGVTMDGFTFFDYLSAGLGITLGDPLSLAPGQSYSGALVDLIVDPSVPINTPDSGSITLLGGFNEFDNLSIGSGTYNLLVVPEASTLPLAAVGVLLMAGTAHLARRRS